MKCKYILIISKYGLEHHKTNDQTIQKTINSIKQTGAISLIDLCLYGMWFECYVSHFGS